MPRSPRWLVQQNRIDEALDALRTVREELDAHEELEEIIESHLQAKVAGICSTQIYEDHEGYRNHNIKQQFQGVLEPINKIQDSHIRRM